MIQPIKTENSPTKMENLFESLETRCLPQASILFFFLNLLYLMNGLIMCDTKGHLQIIETLSPAVLFKTFKN